MGNRSGSVSSRYSDWKVANEGSSQQKGSCGGDGLPSPSSRSSTDSETTSSGNLLSSHNPSHKLSQGSCPEEDVLQAAASFKHAPIKQRKISRAASAGRQRHRRGIPGIPVLPSLSNRSECLTETLKCHVEESWAVIHEVVDSPVTIGCAIYSSVFSSSPELRLLFNLPEDIVDLDGYPPFHRSAKLFASVIDLCVRNIYSLESEMGPVLVMYGRRHFHYVRDLPGGGDSFSRVYLPVFAHAIITFLLRTLPQEHRNTVVHDGWKSLLSFVCERIAEGFDLERHRKASIRRKSLV